jgi:ribosome assembly protein 1
LKDLRESFARIEIQASEPVVPFKETISSFPALNEDMESESVSVGTVNFSIGGNSCSVTVRCLPLSDIVRKYLLDSQDILQNISQESKSTNEMKLSFMAKLKSKFEESSISGQNPLKIDWLKVISNLVAFGPKKTGSNLFINEIANSGWKMWLDKENTENNDTVQSSISEYENSFLQAFNIATQSGPLCAEPMSGVCLVVEKFEIESDGNGETYILASSSILGGQLISSVADSFRLAFLKWSPRLMLAMYSCELQTPTDILGKVYAVLNRRKAKILSEEMKDGTSFFTIYATMHVIDSFGFADDIRKKTSGAASPQLLFYGFELLDIDPFWVPATELELEDYGEKYDRRNPALYYMNLIRKRKGMPVDEKLVEHAEKQKTLKSQ